MSMLSRALLSRQVHILFTYFLLVNISTSQAQALLPEGKRYFSTPTINTLPNSVIRHMIYVDSTTFQDTLYQVLDLHDSPIYYYRKVIDNVCFDGDCRLLNINLYWNVTGSYLGIELPQGEFLSKAEHEPFREREYELLGTLLSDSLSPLGDFTYEELVPGGVLSKFGVDGITSATAPHVLDHVVPGAVYTTYTLWHTVYGKTQKEVQHLTKKVISPALLQAILASPNRGDIYWGLQQIRGKTQEPEIRERILAILSGNDYNLAIAALENIPQEALNDRQFQAEISEILPEVSHSLKGPLLSKLAEATSLHPSSRQAIGNTLSTLTGDHLSKAFDLLRKHDVQDQVVLMEIADLLTSSNTFISERAFNYLNNLHIAVKSIQEKMSKFISVHQQQ